MSENQYLEIIENKLDAVSEMVAQQSKSGVFFDGFTKDVLEKIHNKLDYISNFETQELITYLTNELKRNLEDRNNLVQHRLDVLQNQLNVVQANLNDSLKSSEITDVFTRLSDSVLGFSRDLNAQTGYFNSTVEDIQTKIGNIDIEQAFNEQTKQVKEEIANYKNNLKNFVEEVNSGFNLIKTSIEDNTPSQAILALSGDISVVQKGLNDIVNSIIAMNGKHGELIQSISNLALTTDIQDIKLDVSAIVTEMQILKETLRVLVNKSDIEALNERLNVAIGKVSELKDFSAVCNDENKNTIKSCFGDLSNLISTLVSKDESAVIDEKLKAIQISLDSGANNIQALVSAGNDDVKNLIPLISSLSTKENISELTQKAVQAIDALTLNWSEKLVQNTELINDKINNFRESIGNIGELINEILPKLQEQSSQNAIKIKEEISTLSRYVSEASEKISIATSDSISDLALKLPEFSSSITEQIKNIETVVISAQSEIKESLRSSLSEDIEQLKDFSQKLVETIADLNDKIISQADSVKQVVNDRYDILNEKINELKNLYAESNVENKTEILDGINSLKVIVDAFKNILEDKTSFDILVEKISAVETTLSDSKNEIISSNMQVAGAISNQADLIDAINNSIKDLYINISDGRAVSLGNKAEIIETINQKIFDVASRIDEIKINLNTELSENKESLVHEISDIQSVTSEIKSILQEVNENQASKQILAAILENATEKTDSLKNIILENKDLSLQQYDGIKDLTKGLKQDISDVILILNQSQEFTQNMLERFNAGFSEISSNLSQQMTILKEELENINSTPQTEIIQKIDVIEEKTKEIQLRIENINFDDTLREQLSDIKQQINTFSNESLISVLNSFSEKNQDVARDVKTIMNEIKLSFDKMLENIDLILSCAGNVKTNVEESLNSALEKINENFSRLSFDMQADSCENKNHILAQINDIKETVNTLQEQLKNSVETVLTDSKCEVVNTLENNSRNLENKINQISEGLQSIESASATEVGSAMQTIKSDLVTVKSELSEDFTEKFSTVVQKLELLSNNVGANNYDKQEILEKVSNLQSSTEDLKNYFNGAVDELPKETFIAEQIDKINGLITEFSYNLQNKLDEFENSDKTYIYQSVQEAFISFEQNISDSINYLKGVSLNLDRSFTGTKTEIISGMNELKESFAQFKDNFETNILSQQSSLTEGIKTDFEVLALDNKQELLESISINAKKLEDKIAQILINIEDETINNGLDYNATLQGIKDLHSSVDEIKNDVVNIENKLLSREDISAEIDRVDMALSSLSTGISAKLDEIIDNNSDAAISEIQSYVASIKSDISVLAGDEKQSKLELIDAVNAVNAEIEIKLDANSSKIDAFVADVKTLLDNSFTNLFNAYSQNQISDDEFKESITCELKKAVNEITDRLLKVDEDNSSMRAELLYELQKSFNVLNDKVDNQTAKTGEIKALIAENIDRDYTEIEEIIERQHSDIKSEITKSLSEINVAALKEEINQNITISAIPLQDKLDEIFAYIEQNKNTFEELAKSNCNDILMQISMLKEDFKNLGSDNAPVEVLPEIQRISEKIENISRDMLNEVSNDLNVTFAENVKTITETIEDKISVLKYDIQDVVYKMSEVDSVVDKVKELVTMQFEEFVESFETKLTTLGSDFKNLVEENTEKLTSTIEKYQKELEGLNDIDLKDYNEETKQFVQEQIQILKNRIDELSGQNNLNEVSSGIKEKINSSTGIINKRLELLRNIILSEMPDNEEISGNFDEIKEAINSVNLKTEGVAEIVRNENASLKDVIKSYQAQINELSSIDANASADEDTRDFIRQELKQLKEQFVRNLTGVFENISFIEESEEIQNVIYDNVSEIKDEIFKLKQDIVENSNSNTDVDEKFDKLKNILESITTGATADESSKYVYTLPDVETDIAKMRMAISDIGDMLKKNKEDGFDVVERLDTIDDIRDDISSISKRTNKLILTSDDVNKNLQANIAEFKKILEGVNRSCNRFNSTQINQNIVDVKALVMSSLKSDKILNEAFMHLAEWIDDSARTMNAIDSQVQENAKNITNLQSDLTKIYDKTDDFYEKTNEIALVKNAIEELTIKLDKKNDIDYSKSLYEIEYGLDKLSDKLDVQELKIKSLEKKLESISTAQPGSEEISSLLEFIASQVSAANENSRSNKLLLQKIDVMEKQMTQFEESISKITAFIDGVE